MKKTIAILLIISCFALYGCQKSNSLAERKVAYVENPDSLASKARSQAAAASKVSEKARNLVANGAFKTLFVVPAKGNMQGLAFADGRYFIGFDRKKNRGQIYVCSASGRLIKKTGLLPIGHAAELAYRKSNRSLYVSNCKGPLKILAVNIRAARPYIVKKIVPKIPGSGELVAIDNTRDVMVISVNSAFVDPGSEKKNKSSFVTFYTCDFNGNVLGSFRKSYMGVPQGIECYNGSIYFYTNNKITVFNHRGEIQRIVTIRMHGESEGITHAVQNGKEIIAIGYKGPCRVCAESLAGLHNA